MKSSIKNWFLEGVFRMHVILSTDVFGGNRITIPQKQEEETIIEPTKLDLERQIEVREIPVLRNGSVARWIAEEHEEGEEICLMCECGWVSLPIRIFKEYFHFSAYRENLLSDERAIMFARMHLTEVMGGKVRSFCPFCKKHLLIMLDLRKEKRYQSE